jgi:hypothetical protein
LPREGIPLENLNLPQKWTHDDYQISPQEWCDYISTQLQEKQGKLKSQVEFSENKEHVHTDEYINESEFQAFDEPNQHENLDLLHKDGEEIFNAAISQLEPQLNNSDNNVDDDRKDNISIQSPGLTDKKLHNPPSHRYIPHISPLTIRKEQENSFKNIFDALLATLPNQAPKAILDKYVLLNQSLLAYWPLKHRAHSKPKILLDTKLALNILAIIHLRNHLSVKKMIALFKRTYYVKDVSSLALTIRSNCRICLVSRKPHRHHDDVPGAVRRPEGPFQMLYIDHMFVNQGTTKNKHTNIILNVVDAFSHLTLAQHVSSLSAKEVVRVLENVFSAHGTYSSIISDNGSTLCINEQVRQTCKKFGVHNITVLPYNSQSMSIVEAHNKLLRRSLQETQLLLDEKNWVKVFDFAKYLLNSAPRKYAESKLHTVF